MVVFQTRDDSCPSAWLIVYRTMTSKFSRFNGMQQCSNLRIGVLPLRAPLAPSAACSSATYDYFRLVPDRASAHSRCAYRWHFCPYRYFDRAVTPRACQKKDAGHSQPKWSTAQFEVEKPLAKRKAALEDTQVLWNRLTKREKQVTHLFEWAKQQQKANYTR
jgi:hypothetical protein